VTEERVFTDLNEYFSHTILRHCLNTDWARCKWHTAILLDWQFRDVVDSSRWPYPHFLYSFYERM